MTNNKMLTNMIEKTRIFLSSNRAKIVEKENNARQ